MRARALIVAWIVVAAPAWVSAQEDSNDGEDAAPSGASSSLGVTSEATTTPDAGAHASSSAAATVAVEVVSPSDELADVELETVEVDETVEEPPPIPELPPAPHALFLHGFRLGYLYVFDIESPIDNRDPDSRIYADRYDMRSPHLAMIGYELAWRMIGYDWLNVLLIGNVMFAGFEQSRFFPSANLMIGAEIAEMAQVGIGVSVTPTKEEPVHLAIAAGWTPQIGSFFVPIHAFFVPDINGHHKLGVTVGLNFY